MIRKGFVTAWFPSSYSATLAVPVLYHMPLLVLGNANDSRLTGWVFIVYLLFPFVLLVNYLNFLKYFEFIYFNDFVADCFWNTEYYHRLYQIEKTDKRHERERLLNFESKFDLKKWPKQENVCLDNAHAAWIHFYFW